MLYDNDNVIAQLLVHSPLIRKCTRMIPGERDRSNKNIQFSTQNISELYLFNCVLNMCIEFDLPLPMILMGDGDLPVERGRKQGMNYYCDLR
jgi:hypothetical protein